MQKQLEKGPPKDGCVIPTEKSSVRMGRKEGEKGTGRWHTDSRPYCLPSEWTMSWSQCTLRWTPSSWMRGEREGGSLFFITPQGRYCQACQAGCLACSKRMVFQISKATPGSGFIPFHVNTEATREFSLAGDRAQTSSWAREEGANRVSYQAWVCMLNWLC